MNNHALLIGIGQRADDSKAIAVTATDATRLAEELEKRGGYNANKIRALVGAKAGKTAILRELDSLIKKTTEQKANLVILFYSGHAVLRNGQFYLVSADVENDYLEDSALLGTKFLDKMNLIQANAVLLLLNCCHAGAVGESVDIPFDKSGFINQPNRAILTACTKSEKAFVSTPLSVFTYSLLSGLAGECIKQEQKAKVTLFDLAMYVRENVVAISKGKQHPELSVLKEVATTNFEIVDYSKGIPPFPKEARGGLYDALEKSLEPSSVTDSDYRKQYEWLGKLHNVILDSKVVADEVSIGNENSESSGAQIENAVIQSSIEAEMLRIGHQNVKNQAKKEGTHNAIIGSTIIAKKVDIGDKEVKQHHNGTGDNVAGDKISNHFTIVQPEKENVSSSNLKTELQKLIAAGKIDKALKRFSEAATEQKLDCEDDLIAISAQYANLNKDMRMGVLSKSEERIAWNQISSNLLQLVTELEI
jgi:Caspase domain/Effector-associated domain 11